MIEEARVPEWMLVLTRMTRRRLRLASSVGYVSGRANRGWRHPIAGFLTPPAIEGVLIDQTTPRVSSETEFTPGKVAEGLADFESVTLPAHWAERAHAEAESQRGGQVAELAEPPSDAAMTPSATVSEPRAFTWGGAVELPGESAPSLAGELRVEAPDREPSDAVDESFSDAVPAGIANVPAEAGLATEDASGDSRTVAEAVSTQLASSNSVDQLPVGAALAAGNAACVSSSAAEAAPTHAPPHQAAPLYREREIACQPRARLDLSDYNRIGLDYRRPMPRPKVNGFVVDFHCHLLAARHAPAWFEAADHYGIDCFVTMTALEEAAALQRDWGGRLQFIAVPRWDEGAAALSPAHWVDDFLVRLEAFYNLGSRILKFHAAPGTMALRGLRLDSPLYQPLFREIVARKMGVMTHIGDPDLWYRGKYGSTPQLTSKFGTRDEHYQMWEGLLREYPATPWVGAHLGGNPEDLARLQGLLDRHPNLWLDNSATRWMAREVSQRRDAAREFFIRNRERLLFGTDQVSSDDRGFDFFASRFWAHRKLWETAYAGPSPISDPDLSPDETPMLRGLALPDQALQNLYHDNAVQFLAKVGAGFGGWG